MSIYAPGVLPDPVIRDPLSTAELQFVSLRAGLDLPTVDRFLRDLTEAVDELFTGDDTQQIASACVGFSRRFFERFGPAPDGLIRAPAITVGEERTADFVVYIMSRKEWRLAEFRRRLAHLGKDVIEHIVVDRGFQREDGRELGGFLDGLRNARDNREAVAFVDRNRDPAETLAADHGSYMVSMRVSQDLENWSQLPDAQQEQIMGRRKATDQDSIFRPAHLLHKSRISVQAARFQAM
jgi:deferrochelatase/peroxidase EfeB